jgi:hypothetical protein
MGWFIVSVIYLTIVSAQGNDYYGHYCGFGNTNTFGIPPINEIDRLCQIHDICRAAGTSHCYCSEQLYTLLSLCDPGTTIQSAYRNSILTWAYRDMMFCNDNFQHLRCSVIANCEALPCEKAGYTYLPFFAYNSTRMIREYSGDSNIRMYSTDFHTYINHFVAMAYYKPQNTWMDIIDDKRYQRVALGGLISIAPNSVLIALNDNPSKASYICVEEINALVVNIILKHNTTILHNLSHNVDFQRGINHQNVTMLHNIVSQNITISRNISFISIPSSHSGTSVKTNVEYINTFDVDLMIIMSFVLIFLIMLSFVCLRKKCGCCYGSNTNNFVSLCSVISTNDTKL